MQNRIVRATVYCALFPKSAGCERAVQTLAMFGRASEEEVSEGEPRLDFVGFVNAVGEAELPDDFDATWKIGLVSRNGKIEVTRDPAPQMLFVYPVHGDEDESMQRLARLVRLMIAAGELETEYKVFDADYDMDPEVDFADSSIDAEGHHREQIVIGFDVEWSATGNFVSADYQEEGDVIITLLGRAVDIDDIDSPDADDSDPEDAPEEEDDLSIC